MLELDHERQHETDVRAGERVVVCRSVRRAGVHVDDADALVVLGDLARPCDDRVQLLERLDLQAEVVERRRAERRRSFRALREALPTFLL